MSSLDRKSVVLLEPDVLDLPVPIVESDGRWVAEFVLPGLVLSRVVEPGV